MCFSASASFAAAGVLGVMGIATLKKTTRKEEIPAASIPLIFAFQQLIEGIIWLCLKTPAASCPLVPLSNAYLFFAVFWWPFFFPLAASLIEPNQQRKKVMQFLSVLGLVYALYQYFITARLGLAAYQNDYNLYYYIADEPAPLLFKFLYGVTAMGAGLISSHQMVRLFALLAAVFVVVAWLLYGTNFPSVWCFFGAMLSSLIVLHFYRDKRGPELQTI